MTPLIDPRQGDIEDDVASTKQRSLLAIAGSLLTEISLPKLVLAWVIMIAVPAVLVGLAPLVVSGWLATVSGKVTGALAGISSILLLALVVAVGWLGGRPLFRLAERSFWSLNSLAVQPGYAVCREVLRHLVKSFLPAEAIQARRVALRAATAGGAGILVCLAALGVILVVWPATRWTGSVADLASPHLLLLPALANSIVLVNAYLAGAALVWGIADATMAQPRDLESFEPRPERGRIWRVAHLSDVHVVAERYGFRIECGRAGPRGNGRLWRALEELERLHAEKPLDLVLITGDMTDAGRSAEWAEFLDGLARHPSLAARVLLVPGNHDLNIVDRANPARLDLPTSPGKRLRQVRALSAIAAFQDQRVRIVDRSTRRLGGTLAAALAPHADAIASFAQQGKSLPAATLAEIWAGIFPMVLPPDTDEGLGVILLNSNAETHFSFTNALGMLSTEQARGIAIVNAQYPRACWIVALHHHLVEYPMPAKALSERIGTALINGSWFVRYLQRFKGRAAIMHGHRHIDWIGRCGSVVIVSAPSPVMETTGGVASCFYVHTLAIGDDGRLRLLTPERVVVTGEVGDQRDPTGAPAQLAIHGQPSPAGHI